MPSRAALTASLVADDAADRTHARARVQHDHVAERGQDPRPHRGAHAGHVADHRLTGGALRVEHRLDGLLGAGDVSAGGVRVEHDAAGAGVTEGVAEAGADLAVVRRLAARGRLLVLRHDAADLHDGHARRGRLPWRRGGHRDRGRSRAGVEQVPDGTEPRDPHRHAERHGAHGAGAVQPEHGVGEDVVGLGQRASRALLLPPAPLFAVAGWGARRVASVLRQGQDHTDARGAQG
jgi:hypothetical protein